MDWVTALVDVGSGVAGVEARLGHLHDVLTVLEHVPQLLDQLLRPRDVIHRLATTDNNSTYKWT